IAKYTADTRFMEIVRERVAAAAEAAADPAAEVKPTVAALRAWYSITCHFSARFADNLRTPEPRAAVQTFLDIYSRPSLTWSDIETLRSRTKLPVLLKGIQHPDDA